MLASKKSRPMWTRSRIIAADDLLGDGAQLVRQNHDVVAVPAHAAADVQQDFVEPASARRRSCRRCASVG